MCCCFCSRCSPSHFNFSYFFNVDFILQSSWWIPFRIQPAFKSFIEREYLHVCACVWMHYSASISIFHETKPNNQKQKRQIKWYISRFPQNSFGCRRRRQRCRRLLRRLCCYCNIFSVIFRLSFEIENFCMEFLHCSNCESQFVAVYRALRVQCVEWCDFCCNPKPTST